MKEINLATIDHCTGCAACSDTCPQDCISMQQGEKQLFSYPVIDTAKCISCGRCEKVCPAQYSDVYPITCQTYYCAWNKDMKERQTSTSGGVGSAISAYAYDSGYTVFGCAFDENWNLLHRAASSREDLASFKGSKYLQSNTEGVYKEIRKKLDAGQKVLFIGTPCQVAALKNFTPTRFQNMILTCEIICHGVNSPRVWRHNVNVIQDRAKSKLIFYNFRDKSKGWQKPNGTTLLRTCYKFANGKEVNVPAWKNQFHCWFGHHYILRTSCLQCRFRKLERVGDLVMGDFWGVQNILSEADLRNGCSVIISNSPAGDKFIKNVDSLCLTKVDSAKSSRVLRGFITKETLEQQAHEISVAKRFEQEYSSSSYEEMEKRYPHMTSLEKIIRALKLKLNLK